MGRKITVLVRVHSGELSGSSRVNRGGSWRSDPAVARVAYRIRNAPGIRWSFLGFRVVVEIPCPER